MDLTPLLHSLIALTAQTLIGASTGNWWLGGALACTWWLAREHTQAEYRWIERFGHGKRANLPWWGGFDPRIWDAASVLDWLVPLFFCSGLYFLLYIKFFV